MHSFSDDSVRDDPALRSLSEERDRGRPVFVPLFDSVPSFIHP